MKTIWKFPLERKDGQLVYMPNGSQLLTVQNQNGTPTLWAIVDPEKAKAGRQIICVGTGHPLSETMAQGKYLGTTQDGGGLLVWHWFSTH